jgi:hypothetical protein
MDFSQRLTDLWVLFGELCEEIVHGIAELAALVRRNPQMWPWLTIWLGVVWLCVRWTKIVTRDNERRLYEAAEARLHGLMIAKPAGAAEPPAPEAPAAGNPAAAGEPVRSDRADAPQRRRKRPKRSAPAPPEEISAAPWAEADQHRRNPATACFID